MAQSINFQVTVGLICLTAGSALVFPEDDPPASPNPGVRVCVGLMTCMKASYDLNSAMDRRSEYAILREELKRLPFENLEKVQESADIPFLAKRIAKVELAYRGFSELDRFFLPKNPPSQSSFTTRARERLQSQFSERYAREEYRGWWEYKLLFEHDYKFAMSGLATIGSADSVPLLESFYEWKANRLRESGIGKPVRLDILATMAKIRVPESYVALAKIWGGNTSNDEEKKLITESLAQDPLWTKLASELSPEEKETYRAFQDAVNGARKPEPTKESEKKESEKPE